MGLDVAELRTRRAGCRRPAARPQRGWPIVQVPIAKPAFSIDDSGLPGDASGGELEQVGQIEHDRSPVASRLPGQNTWFLVRPLPRKTANASAIRAARPSSLRPG